MQKGRGYRAALPRNNLPEFGYNQRWPMRMDFRGSFDFNGINLMIPATQVRGLANYHPLDVAWSNTNTYTIGLLNFSETGTVKQVDAPWMWQVQLDVTDGVGHTINTWVFDNRFMPRIGLGPNWLFPPPTTIVTSGFFGPHSFLQFVPVVYAAE